MVRCTRQECVILVVVIMSQGAWQALHVVVVARHGIIRHAEEETAEHYKCIRQEHALPAGVLVRVSAWQALYAAAHATAPDGLMGRVVEAHAHQHREDKQGHALIIVILKPGV